MRIASDGMFDYSKMKENGDMVTAASCLLLVTVRSTQVRCI